MKNEIIFSYRLIKLIYYLIALYVAITYVNEISKAICYILILVLILGCAMYIYLIIVYKIYSKSINLEKNIKKTEAIINYGFRDEISRYHPDYRIPEDGRSLCSRL